jgi:hypothetical protein
LIETSLGYTDSIVTVAVVDVREVRVTVPEWFVNVSVGMRITWRVIRCMGVLVVSVVSVRMSV